MKEGLNFVEYFLAEKIYLPFEMVHDHVFHAFTARPSFMRLWSLYQALDAKMTIYIVAFLDPYHMHVFSVESQHGKEIIANYRRRCMLASPGKDTLLMPYCALYVLQSFMLAYIPDFTG